MLCIGKEVQCNFPTAAPSPPEPLTSHPPQHQGQANQHVVIVCGEARGGTLENCSRLIYLGNELGKCEAVYYYGARAVMGLTVQSDSVVCSSSEFVEVEMGTVGLFTARTATSKSYSV